MNPSGTTRTDEQLVGDALERRLEELLQQDRFPAPAGFQPGASVSVDAASAEADPNAFWADQARTLHWDRPRGTRRVLLGG